MTKISSRPLRVCIDARIVPGQVGGVEQFIIGLAHGLSKLNGGEEEFVFLAYPDNYHWIEPYIHGQCRMVHGTAATRHPRWTTNLRRLPGSGMARKIIRSLASQRHAANLPLPRSDGFVEQNGFDVVHFPMQQAFLTDIPSIYQPWDLQHLHLPQYFDDERIRFRETTYRAFCEQASMVAVASDWQKKDIIRHFGLSDEKVQVVPGAPPSSAYTPPTAVDVEQVREKCGFADGFIFYPAQTYPHKNHIGLLKALELIRRRHGLVVPFVSSGKLSDYYGQIESEANALGVRDQVRFLGFVTPAELQSLYRLCKFVVFPTEFEGLGMPVLEAFHSGVACACSNVTALPEHAGEAAVMFDPRNTEQMADAILNLWRDSKLRANLVQKGFDRVSQYSWDRTARLFRAHYRRIGGRPLSGEDQAILSAEI